MEDNAGRRDSHVNLISFCPIHGFNIVGRLPYPHYIRS